MMPQRLLDEDQRGRDGDPTRLYLLLQQHLHPTVEKEIERFLHDAPMELANTRFELELIKVGPGTIQRKDIQAQRNRAGIYN
jgi:hypothetical protein